MKNLLSLACRSDAMKKKLCGLSLRYGLMIAFAFVGQASLCAQQSAVTTTPSATPSSATLSEGSGSASAVRVSGDQYRIGPRDVLSIRVNAGRPVPELSFESIEVDECGRIPLPSVQYE